MASELSDQEKERLRDSLFALREELAHMLSSSSGAAVPVDLDEPIGRLSRMDAMQQQSMVVANRRAARSRQKQVDAALARFDEGDYGECLDCGEVIDPRRLAAHPETPFCFTCQGARERRR